MKRGKLYLLTLGKIDADISVGIAQQCYMLHCLNEGFFNNEV